MSTRASIYCEGPFHLFDSFMCREGCVGLQLTAPEWDDLGENPDGINVYVDLPRKELTAFAVAWLQHIGVKFEYGE